MNQRNQMPIQGCSILSRGWRAALALSLSAVLGGCGDEGGNNGECGPGEFCPCETTTDCRGGEVCAQGLCVPRGIAEDVAMDVEQDIRRLDIQDEDVDLDAFDTEFPPFRDTQFRDSEFPDGDDEDADTGDDADVDDDSDTEADADVDDSDVDTDAGGDADLDGLSDAEGDADLDGLSDAAGDVDADGMDADGVTDAVDSGGDDADGVDTGGDGGTTPDTGSFERGNPWIAYVQDHQLRFMRADGTGDIAWAGPLSRRVFDMAWSPDGTMLVVSGVSAEDEAQVVVIDFLDREFTVATLLVAGSPVVPTSDIAWSPGGETIAFTYRPPGVGNVFSIWTAPAGSVVGGSAVLTAVPGADAGDCSPVWGEETGDLYFLRRATGGSSSIVAVDFPSTTARTVVGGLSFLGLFSLDGAEEFLLAQVAGATSYGELRQVEVGVRNALFGRPGDSAPAFFGGADTRAVFVRDFSTGGSPQMDMVLYQPGEAELVRLTNTGSALGPSTLSVAPVDNSDLTLGPFPF